MIATIRALRHQRAFAPGGPESGTLVLDYLPLVYGSATLLFPGSETSVHQVVKAVFQTFVLRWRRTSRRTNLATWFLRTTWIVARREQRRLQRSVPTSPDFPSTARALFGRLLRLPAKCLNALLWRHVLLRSAAETSQALGVREKRIEARAQRGLRKLTRTLRRSGPPSAQEVLETLAQPAPPEFADALIVQLRAESPASNPLTTAAVSAWRWIRFKRVVVRLVKTAATGVGLLVLLVAALVWLQTQGYLTMVFIRLSNWQRLKHSPELAQLARPWPAGTESAPLAAAIPADASALYGLTNIWPARIRLGADGWRQLQPTRVHPVNMMHSDGHMTLRNPNARRNGLSGVIGLDFNWAEGQLEFGGTNFAKVAVRYRGNGTYVNSLFGPKQSFKVELNKYKKGQHLAGIRTLNFVNSIPDNSYVHDALAERLFRDLGVPAPRTAYAYLTIDAAGRWNNQPLGLYVLIENVDAEFAQDHFGSKKTPLFKPVTTELFQDLGSDWNAYAGIYDLKTHATPEQKQRLIEFARLVTHADDADFNRRLPEFLDLDEFARFLAGQVLLSSYDGFLSDGQNFYVYLDPRSNRFGFIPWDNDHSWGEFGYIGTAESREKASIWQPSTYSDRFLNRVLKVDVFRTAYERTLRQALTNLFVPERLEQQVDELARVIRPAVAAESDFRLHRFDLGVSDRWVPGPRDGVPEGPQAPVHQIKRFILNRAKSVREQLDGTNHGVALQGWHGG